MNIRNTGVFLLAALVGVGVNSHPALASRPTGEQISGVLSAVHNDGIIVVAGRSLHVKSNSPASSALASLQPGKTVTVTLNGPAASSSSEVVNISVRQGDK